MGLDIVSNTTPVKKVASFNNWTLVHIQVRDASTIFLSNNRKALEVPGPGASQGGLAITAADGIKSLNWIGDLYITGSNIQSLFDLETFDDVTPPTCQ